MPIRKAASRLDVSVKTIMRWHAAGRLDDGDCVRVGQRWKMRPEAVEMIRSGDYAGLSTAV